MAFRPIFYDTETTGVRPNQDKIIELAAFDPEQDRTFEMLINPGRPIPAEASQIHHITDDMVKDSPDFGTVAEEFVNFCSGDIVLIAHNNDAFDLPFMEIEFTNAGLTFPKLRTLDSLKWARRFRPDLPRHALQFLREIYGIEQNNAHRALDDVIILHKVFSLMIDDLPFDEVLDLMSKPQIVSRMPFGKHQGKHLKDVPSGYVTWLDSSGALDKKDNEDLKKAFLKLGFLQKDPV